MTSISHFETDHIANYREAQRLSRLSSDQKTKNKHLQIGEIFRSLAVKELRAVAVARRVTV